ncbi:MAG: SDR family oxidoreductase [Phycisphaerales bacterium]
MTLEHFGRIDHLINNAAIGTCAPLGELTESQIEQLVRINLTAPLLLTRLALPHLSKQNGCVISIGSRAAIDPFPGLGTYGCTRVGLEDWHATSRPVLRRASFLVIPVR